MQNSTKIKIIVYAAILLDVLSLGVFIPASEKLINRYGVTAFWIGVGLSIYSLASLIATPVLGQLSDKYGRKKLLLLCVLGTALSYLVLLLTHNYWIFIISRIINGITGGNFAILQSIISDISKDENDRKKNLGFMGAMFGLGFIIGPIIGSIGLALGGVSGMFWIGTGLAVFDLIAIYFLLAETHKERIQHQTRIDYLGFRTLARYLGNKEISLYLRSMMFLGIGIFIYQGVLAIQVNQTYGIGGEKFGYILAIIGFISVFNLAFLVPKFRIPNFKNKQIIFTSHIGLLISILLLIFVTSYTSFNLLGFSSYTIFLSLLGILALFNIYMPIYQSNILSKTEKFKVGEVSGVTTSIGNIGMILGPLIGGLLLDSQINVYIGGFILIFVSLIIIFINRKKVI